jgi:AAA family ATP:ADP antiporter
VLLSRWVNVKGPELRALVWAWLYFFTLLSGYYVLRPLREEMGIAGGVEQLHWLFTGTFVATLLLVPLYSALVARFPRQRIVPIAYRFFLLNLLAFAVAMKAGVAPVWIARAFYIWLSVYNLFVVSVFWSLMADLFSSEQAKRLFGFIATGGTAGAILGPLLTTLLAKSLGMMKLLVLSAVLLEVSSQCVHRLLAWRRRQAPVPENASAPTPSMSARIGGTPLSGIRQVFQSRYLLAMSLQTVLFTFTSTVVYFQQAHVVRASIASPEARTAFFAAVDLAVNVLTVVMQLVLTGPLLSRVGVTAGLCALPALSTVGFVGLAFAPRLPVLAVFQSLRRAGHYAVDRPSREVLFTVLPLEQKYKSKAFIDTAVYRGSDALTAWFFSGLRSLGLEVSGTAAVAVPFCLAWMALAGFLGRRHDALKDTATPEGATTT